MSTSHIGLDDNEDLQHPSYLIGWCYILGVSAKLARGRPYVFFHVIVFIKPLSRIVHELTHLLQQSECLWLLLMIELNSFRRL